MVNALVANPTIVIIILKMDYVRIIILETYAVNAILRGKLSLVGEVNAFHVNQIYFIIFDLQLLCLFKFL